MFSAWACSLRRRSAAMADVAGLDDGLEGLPLVGGVALHRLDQVGDEVVAALELHVDLGPGVLDPVPQLDQAVVHDDDDEHDQDDDARG